MDEVQFSIDNFFDGKTIREGGVVYNPPSAALVIGTFGLGLVVPALIKMGIKRIKK